MSLFEHSRNQILRGLAITGAALTMSYAMASPANAADYADFLFIVDESGSMAGEHSWLGSMINGLDTGLQAKGVGAGAQSNRFGLVGFGKGGSGVLGRTLPVGGQQFGTASELALATNSLIASGGFEDGYAAIDFAFGNYQFRENAAVNVVLVTDEDRDVGNSSLSFQSTLNLLQSHGALLNAVVNYSANDTQGNAIVGADAHGNAFVADGSGGYTTTAFNTAVANSRGFGTTAADYTALAWATGSGNLSGATWDLNKLRAGGNTASSFTQAFVDIKAQEARRQGETPARQEEAPEPGATLLITGLVLGLGKKFKERMA